LWISEIKFPSALQSHSDLAYAVMFRAAACVRLGEIEEARRMSARIEKNGFGSANDNIFRPVVDTLWKDYTDAIRQAMECEPRT
jgi:hypothetical protein